MEAYQVRFVDEYQQLCNKYGKLLKILRDIDLGLSDFQPRCPIELLKEQADIMACYIDVLLRRATYENIELPHYNFQMMRGDEYGKY